MVICDPRRWAYSVALDGASNRGNSYIDVCLRFAAKEKIHNVNGLVIPIQDPHTEECVYEIVKQFLEGVLGAVWKDKLLSIANDGAKNMNGMASGAVARFENVAHSGFFHLWCAAHQLDLVVQHSMSGLFQDEFRSPLNALIAHLRRQYTLCPEIGTTCPTVAETHWL